MLELDFLVLTVRLKEPAEPAEAKTRLGSAPCAQQAGDLDDLGSRAP